MCNAYDSFNFFYLKKECDLFGWLVDLSELCVLHMTKTNVIFLLVIKVQSSGTSLVSNSASKIYVKLMIIMMVMI